MIEERQEGIMQEQDEREDGEAAALVQAEAEGRAGAEVVYRTQREIDAAMGRRLRQERERWEKKHRAALLLEELFGEQGAQEAAIKALAGELGLSLEEARACVEGGLGREEMERLARQRAMEREMEQLREAEAQRLALELEAAREEGRQEVIRSIRERQVRPSVLRGHAGGGIAADFSNMPESALRTIDERLKRGERVRV